MLSVDTAAGDLCPHRPVITEFRQTGFWLELGHTSSEGILFATTPLNPAAVPCLPVNVQELISVLYQGHFVTYISHAYLSLVPFSLQHQTELDQLRNKWQLLFNLQY